jgi:hypothetical protein
MPLFRAGLTLGAIIPIALATDTVSITIMEVIENVTMLVFPGAMEAGLDTLTFWGPMALGFAIAFPFAFAANRYLLRRARATRSCTSTTTPTDSTPTDRRRRRRCGALGPLTAVLAAL